jgi:IS5 family transposase
MGSSVRGTSISLKMDTIHVNNRARLGYFSITHEWEVEGSIPSLATD